MMGVVVDHGDPAIRLADDVEAALRAGKTLERLFDDVQIDAQREAGSRRSKAVRDVMLAGHRQFDAAQELAPAVQIVARHAEIVEFDALRVVIARFVETERDDLARQILRDGLHERVGVERDDQAVCRYLFREFLERFRDMVDVLEVVQVVRIDVQDDLRPGPQPNCLWCRPEIPLFVFNPY